MKRKKQKTQVVSPRRHTRRKIKTHWKISFGVIGLGMSALFFIVFYYGFDPELLADLSFYQNLANPSMRIVRVEPGLRKEQVAEVLFKNLGWNETQKNEFINSHLALNTGNEEGKFFPKTYLMPKDATPLEARDVMLKEFYKAVGKTKKPAEVINEDVIIKIASIIERESGGKKDMRLISGIIWNRIWADMKLQMDATLQYAKGNEEDGWWGKVASADKYIESPYNTYKYPGLPPSPIASPGADAIYAAYNPAPTKCMFYIHDKKRVFHCSETYSGQKANIEKYY